MKKEILSLPKYKNAFRCHKCPQTNDITGCPKWIEFEVTNDLDTQAKEKFKIEAGCSDVMLPRLLLDIVKGVHTGAKETSKLRKATARSVGTAAAAYLQAKGFEEVPVNVDMLEGSDESRKRLVLEGALEFAESSEMLDNGMDNRNNEG